MERKRMGLDKPLVAQFGEWMVGMATLDFGNSMWTERPVMEEIALRLELSLQVAIDGDDHRGAARDYPWAHWRRCSATPGSTTRSGF